MGQSSSSATCRNSPTNAYWNNVSNSDLPQQSDVALPHSLLSAFLAYAIVGAIASVFNVVCILIFLTKKEHRAKYMLYALLTFGNLLNTLFMFIAGIERRQKIFANQWLQVRSSFECLEQVAPHLQLMGGQLPALVIFVINTERFIAVYKPVFYKFKFTLTTRLCIAIGCIVAVSISQLIGYLCAYLSTYCSNYWCSPTSIYRLKYSNYNTAVIILFPLVALILNIITYIGAKKSFTDIGNMKKELNRIFVALAITSVNVVMIAIPNFLLWVTIMGFFSLDQVFLAYSYVLFCCSSVTDLFVYAALKRDFRNHLLISISFGALRSYLKENNGIKLNQWATPVSRASKSVG